MEAVVSLLSSVSKITYFQSPNLLKKNPNLQTLKTVHLKTNKKPNIQAI